MTTRPVTSSARRFRASSNSATGPSYSSPWLAPVRRAVGPLPRFTTAIGIMIAPHAESSRLYGSLRWPCCTPSRSKSTDAAIGDGVAADIDMLKISLVRLRVGIEAHPVEAHRDVAAPYVTDGLEIADLHRRQDIGHFAAKYRDLVTQIEPRHGL